MNEVWKVCPVNSKYECSSLGNIRRVGKSSNLKMWFNKATGYYQINLGSENRHQVVHRLIALTFLEDINEDVDHIDRNKLNNIVSNLRWVTHQENMNNRDLPKLKEKIVNCKKTNKTYTYYKVSYQRNKERIERHFKTEKEAIEYLNEVKSKIFNII